MRCYLLGTSSSAANVLSSGSKMRSKARGPFVNLGGVVFAVPSHSFVVECRSDEQHLAVQAHAVQCALP